MRISNETRSTASTRLARGACVVAAALLAEVGPVSAAPGDYLTDFDATGFGVPPCVIGAGTGAGTGLAYDGANLILSCGNGNELWRVGAAAPHASAGPFVITGLPNGNALGALSWDPGRGKLWACNGDTRVVLIDMATRAVVASPAPVAVVACTDGLAYDASDDTLWVGPYNDTIDDSGWTSDRVYHYRLDGTPVGSFPIYPDPLGTGLLQDYPNSGIVVAGSGLYLANHNAAELFAVPKDGSSSSFLGGVPIGLPLEDLACDGDTFKAMGVDAIWGVEQGTRNLYATEIPPGSCGSPPCPPENSQVTTTVEANGDITVNFIQSLINANDNSYGTSAVWVGTAKGAHTFGNLTGSDKAEFIFKDKNGNVVLDFFLDYLSAASGTASGYASLGPDGGDGKMILGNRGFIKDFNTSLARNLNDTGFCASGICTVAGVNLRVNSPPTVCTDNTLACYALPAGSPFGAWDFKNSYTVTIDKAAFGAAGFGSVAIGMVHNSPSKGTASICGQEGGGVCDLEGTGLSFDKKQVTFTVTNNGNGDAILSQVMLGWPAANGKLKKISFDKNAVYDKSVSPPTADLGTADLVSDATKRTIAAGTSAVVTVEFEKNISTDPANYSGTFRFGTGCSVTFGSTGGACVLGYPFASSNPRTSVVFNESEVLQAFDPAVAGPGDTLRLFAADEHAILLGVRTATKPVSALPSVPGRVSNPLVGDKTKTDPSGRPIFPAIYITDITGITDTSTGNVAYRAGDWQYGGTPIAPNDVFGTWKGASASGSILTTDADPAKNTWNLGPGSDTPSAGFPSLTNQGYGIEVRWNVNDLGLLPGHTYRVQYMVHDGDQNKIGGDVGQACSLVVMR